MLGGRYTNTAEMYAICEDRFTPLPLLLPGLGCASALFVGAQHVAVLQTSAITYWNSEGEAVRAALAESLGSQESIILGREGL